MQGATSKVGELGLGGSAPGGFEVRAAAFGECTGTSDQRDDHREQDPFSSPGRARLGEAQTAHGFTGGQELKFIEQRGRIRIAVSHARGGGFDDDLIQFEVFCAVFAFTQIGGEAGKIIPIVSGGDFVEHLS